MIETPPWRSARAARTGPFAALRSCWIAPWRSAGWAVGRTSGPEMARDGGRAGRLFVRQAMLGPVGGVRSCLVVDTGQRSCSFADLRRPRWAVDREPRFAGLPTSQLQQAARPGPAVPTCGAPSALDQRAVEDRLVVALASFHDGATIRVVRSCFRGRAPGSPPAMRRRTQDSARLDVGRGTGPAASVGSAAGERNAPEVPTGFTERWAAGRG